jgi:hypothetical protein
MIEIENKCLENWIVRELPINNSNIFANGLHEVFLYEG